jgi:choline dehydrogenase-like flavoprotein
VLAAGAFQTPQLLMLSGIGPGEHLREMGLSVRIDRPAVGANLQDHVDYVAAFETEGSFFLGRSALGSLKSLGALLRWLFTRKGADDHALCRGGAFLRTDPADPRPMSSSIS